MMKKTTTKTLTTKKAMSAPLDLTRDRPEPLAIRNALPGSTSSVTRVPLRPETPEQEIQRYPERLRRHEEREALVQQAQSEEGATHRRNCTRKGCPHAAHVRPRRLLREETREDRRHLGACDKEDPACLDPSHLLPPHPIDVTKEYCCEGQHFRVEDPRALSECPMVPVWLRERRHAEQRAFRDGARGFGGVTVVRSNHVTGTTDISSGGV